MVGGLVSALLVPGLAHATATSTSASPFQRAAMACFSSQTEPETRIAQCEAVIASGQANKRMLAEALANRGMARSATLDYPASIPDFEAALRTDRTNVLAHFGLGVALSETGQLERAIGAFTNAIALRPDIGQLYRDRGRTFTQLKQHARAIADLDTAVKLAADAYSFELRGRAKIAAQDFDGAVADLNEAIRLEPKQALAYEQRGYAYFLKRDAERAFADLNHAAELEPTYSSVYFKRSLVHLMLGDRDREIADLDEAIRLNPKFPEALNNRGVAFRDRSDNGRALADFTAAIRALPDARMPLTNRASLRASMNDHEGAVLDYGRLIAIEPDNSEHYLHRGQSYVAQRNADAALADFAKALDLYPGDPRAWQGKKQAEALKEGRPVGDVKSEPAFDFANFRSMLGKSKATP